MSSRAGFYSTPLSLQWKTVLIIGKIRVVLTACRPACPGLRGRAPSYRGFLWLPLALADELNAALSHGQAYRSYAETVFADLPYTINGCLSYL